MDTLLVNLARIMFSDSIWKVPFCISYAAGHSLAQLVALWVDPMWVHWTETVTWLWAPLHHKVWRLPKS